MQKFILIEKLVKVFNPSTFTMQTQNEIDVRLISISLKRIIDI